MSPAPLSILISGAGVAGTTLALVLARHPAFQVRPSVTVVERSPVPRIGGQALDIRAHAVKVIRKLGLEQNIKGMHTTEKSTAWVDKNGKAFAQIAATGNAEKQSLTSEYEILRGDLIGLMMKELGSAEVGANVKFVYGERIAALDDQPDGVMVDFAGGKLESQKFDVVIAADGTGSKTRSMIFPELAVQDCIKPMGWSMAFFTIPRKAHDMAQWRIYNGTQGRAIYFRPHRDELKTMGVYLCLCAPRREQVPEIDDVISAGIGAQKDYLRKRFTGMGWETERFLDGMDDASDFYMQQLAMVKTPDWVRGRCAILGDAAHAIMGVGTTYAIIGAYILAGELSKVHSNNFGEITKALRRYHEAHRSIVNIRDLPAGLPQLGNPQTRFGVALLNLVIMLLYWTGLHRLIPLADGDESLENSTLSDYGW